MREPAALTETLCGLVEQRLRTALHHEFRQEQAVLYRVRGQVDMLRTARGQLLQQGRVACRYTAVTADTVVNRAVLAALNRLRRLPMEGRLIKHCQKLAAALSRCGVGDVCPSRHEIRAVRLSSKTPDARKDTCLLELAREILRQR